MLDFAWEVKPNSRLSCQIKISTELDGLDGAHAPPAKAEQSAGAESPSQDVQND